MLKERGAAASTLKAALTKDFERLEEVVPGRKIGERAARFVADGTDDSCLLEIAGIQNPGHYQFMSGQQTVRWNTLDALSDASPAVLYRFAKLMLASAGQAQAVALYSHHRHRRGPDWLHAYVDTSQCRPIQAFNKPRNRKIYSIPTLRAMFEEANEPLGGMIEALYGSGGYTYHLNHHTIEGRDALLRDEWECVAGVVPKLDPMGAADYSQTWRSTSSARSMRI